MLMSSPLDIFVDICSTYPRVSSCSILLLEKTRRFSFAGKYSTGYLDRFSYIYLDGGLIPDQVFQLREKKTGLCLQLDTLNGNKLGDVLHVFANHEGLFSKKEVFFC